MLRGRVAEQVALDRMLGQVREGHGAVLVVRGPAGIGKSALLQHAVDRAQDLVVVRADGVAAERELPFAGLHRLCWPLVDRAETLPDRHRAALDGALGHRAASPPEPVDVGLALLHLLTVAAARERLLCVIDDAQWLDRPSAQALGFAARRLGGAPVGLLVAERADEDGAGRDELAKLATLRLAGLADADARALLAAAAAGPLDPQVRDRVVAEARGSPRALLELPRRLSAAGLAGGFGLGDGLPLAGPLEASVRRQVAALPPDTRRFVLVAAAEPTGDPTLLWDASARLGLPVEAIGPAEAAGLLQVGTRVTFRHPLLRSAVYHAACPADRRAVHRALAAATDARRDPDRRAWHRAQATVGPDEAVADALERAADRAQARGGLPAAAAFLERATALTPDPRRRAARALRSAEAKVRTGAFDEALALLGLAEASGWLDPQSAARAALARGQIAFAAGRISVALHLLLETAGRHAPRDPALVRETYRGAFHAALVAGRCQPDGGPPAVASVARRAPPAAGAAGPPELLLLDGMTAMLGGRLDTGTRRVRAALPAFRDGALAPRQELDWLPIACRMALCVLDAGSWDVLSARLVDRAREAGAAGILPFALVLRLLNRVLAGELAVAAELDAEVHAVDDAAGGRDLMASYGAVALAAWQGRPDAADEAIAVARERHVRHGAGELLTATHWARAVLANALGRFDVALAAAEEARAWPGELGLATFALLELIEAAALGGDPDRAARGVAELVPLTQASGSDWALGTEARARALVEDDAAEPRFREALRRLRRTGMRADLARAHLHYGEWLRRRSRRQDAREHLRTARDMFAAMGAAAFADRAARSLAATGERARSRTDGTRDELTAQEAQIADLARQGLSNPEIGARLLISARTVEYHLGKVFAKLGISSRTQLERALPLASRRLPTTGGGVRAASDPPVLR
jgi:DNA-binding CsgD family transcriptional regulator